MNQRKAKMLRKLAGFDANEPKQYENVIVAKKRFIQFNGDGSSEDIIKDRNMTLRLGLKQVYKRYKRAFYTLKTKGGHRFAKKEA